MRQTVRRCARPSSAANPMWCRSRAARRRRRAAAAARRWTTSTSASRIPCTIPVEVAEATLRECATLDFTGVRSRSAYLMGVLGRKVADLTASAAARARTASLGAAAQVRRRRRQGRQGRRGGKGGGRAAAAAAAAAVAGQARRARRRRRASTRSSPLLAGAAEDGGAGSALLDLWYRLCCRSTPGLSARRRADTMTSLPSEWPVSTLACASPRVASVKAVGSRRSFKGCCVSSVASHVATSSHPRSPTSKPRYSQARDRNASKASAGAA